ncbi:type I-B CRISPR-associated protein Cas5b [Natranaerofaba carboxydovora]|uniref:type I-B CRISPR-associated protein Cas5b n=1 Tax=Natranaerofaba carboxydovora TaxID=2742683 RepID=UPI001F132717|nr:type I-B CRISPR-associated protein Cas5b [Natranaerofaba carboxydovora]UMZ73543.1 CRISPR-associated protein (Cas_Cas5) [Natranaerofaba carboxydovora]
MVSSKKALRIKLFQETACYKKPLAFKAGETYPLPPFSTIKGMLHHVMDANEFIPMNISVQGDYECSFKEYQTHYFYRQKAINKGLGQAPITIKTQVENDLTRDNNMISTSPITKYVLKDVTLIIHVIAEEEVLQKLQTALNECSFISLGAAEYLVRIDEVAITELRPIKEDIEMQFNCYIRREQIMELDLNCVPFSLCWKYEIVNGTREWEKIEAGYVKKGQLLFDTDDILVDDENNPAFLCLPVND